MMRFATLGNTATQVSSIGLGTMTWGVQVTIDAAFAQLDYAISRGVNLVDTAETYPIPPIARNFGLSEEILGDWLDSRRCRDNIVISTKVAGRGTRSSGLKHLRDGPRLSADQIVRAAEGSLRRLRTDRIDIFHLHWPERMTDFTRAQPYPSDLDDGIDLLESLEALDSLVKAGKVINIGLSNETPWGLMRCLHLASEHGLARIECIQNAYSLLNRRFEYGGAEVCIREKVGHLAYSPLARGVLVRGTTTGEEAFDTRTKQDSVAAVEASAETDRAIQEYCRLAVKFGLRPAHLALAFARQREFVTSVILGATTISQLRENIASADIELTDEILGLIGEIGRRRMIVPPPV